MILEDVGDNYQNCFFLRVGAAKTGLVGVFSNVQNFTQYKVAPFCFISSTFEMDKRVGQVGGEHKSETGRVMITYFLSNQCYNTFFLHNL